MGDEYVFSDGRIRRWWTGFAAALLLLLPLDLLTTFLSVSQHGLGVEANPLMLWLLNRGMLELVLVHLGVILFAVVGFELAIRAIERAPARTRARAATGVDAWVVAIVVGGLLLVTNNLLTVV